MVQPGRDETDQNVDTGVAIDGGNTGTVIVNKITNLGTGGAFVVAGGLVIVALVLYVAIRAGSGSTPDQPSASGADEIKGAVQGPDSTGPVLRTEETPAPNGELFAAGQEIAATDQPELIADPKFDTERLSGLFNVAVLEFSTGEQSDRSAEFEAEDAADELVAFLRSELGPDSALSDIDVGFYERSDDRSDLNQFAAEVNANMVVTATLSVEDGESVFAPVFLIPSGSLAEAEELAGFHALGKERRWNETFTSEAVRTELRSSVQTRSEALVYLVRGLSAYRAKQYDRATTSFAKLVNSPDCQGPLGSLANDDAGIHALGYTFLANAAIFNENVTADQAGRLDMADRCFALALRAFPDSPRADLGRAAIAFQRTREVCDTGVETDAPTAPPELITDLEQTELQYLAARSNYLLAVENGRPEIPFLETATQLGLGRIQLCLSLAGEPRWADARVSFEEAIADYTSADGAPQRRLASLASEAYAGLGLLELRGPYDLPDFSQQYNDAWAGYDEAKTAEEVDAAQTIIDGISDQWYVATQAHFARAEAAFDSAIALVDDNDRRRLFHAMRANARFSQSDIEGSERDCLEALSGGVDLSCPDFGPSFFDIPPDEVLGLAITGSRSGHLAVAGLVLVALGIPLVYLERITLPRRN